ncbi:MAG TPA: IPT/TIG domain-containing protein [Candidatus Angelobacter sp.]|nr:IPT/TIG domain-containing protein [Candidatus Angelobacter sp.]
MDSMPLIPPDDPPPIDPPSPPPPPPPAPTLSRISPIAGALTGGITVTLTGTGFVQGGAVYFGSTPAATVSYESGTTVRAQLPPSANIGSVSVSVVNPDGSTATLAGGFTYITTVLSDRAEVLGVAPLAVIENTDTQVTLRGRNLIAAYNGGLLALRGPSRAAIAISGFTSSVDPITTIESLIFTVRVTATPPLAPIERMAIQILASLRPAAQSGPVAQSSRQMFTVLPQAVPVPLAYTANIEPGKPTLVMVAGRNLAGCSLDLGPNVTLHLQRSDDRVIAGVASIPANLVGSTSTLMSVQGATGAQVAQYAMSVSAGAPLATASAPPSPGGQVAAGIVDPIPGAVSLNFTPVPGQRMVAPTATDSMVASIRGDSFGGGFDWFNFEITIIDFTIVLPLIHEVHLVSFFDGGGELNSPILATVGTLFPLRGMGLLVALKIEITIHITVILIIGFIFDIWPDGLFNEFPEFPWAIGSIIISVVVEIDIFFNISFLTALVLPGGRLRVLEAFNLTIGIDFSIDTDGRYLHFHPQFTHAVHFGRIAPRSLLELCSGRFQLASENGNTVFPDAFGGYQSFYFARTAGQCCVPWDFDLQLVQFAPGEAETTLEGSFSTEFCLNAQPSPNQMKIIITSAPPPTGVPPTLVMNVADSATIKALAQPVDEAGNPTGPLKDVRDLGYGVQFYLESPPDVLDPASLLQGGAFAVLPGVNIIHAALTSVRIVPTSEPQFTFWPGGVLGFEIAKFLASGQPPKIQSGLLPVQVNPLAGTITVDTKLAYRDEQNHLIEVSELERYEPFETPRTVVLAAKITIPDGVSLPQTLTFTVNKVQMQPPLSGTNFQRGRDGASDPSKFFSGNLVKENQTGTITVNSMPASTDLFEVTGLAITPNNKEEAATATASPTKFVPPGPSVTGAQTQISIDLKVTANGGAPVAVTRSVLGLTVRNDESYEEYLRVFDEAQRILSGTSLEGFAQAFYGELVSKGATTGATTDVLKTQGDLLWTRAYQAVQAASIDDRPLYYARLQAIAALRAYHRRKNLQLSDALINAFEWPSRGLAVDGSINFGLALPGVRKSLVTGFDPFQLLSQPDRSNPSGLIALYFNAKTLNPGSGPVYVRTAIFPVRYKDFASELIENAVRGSLGSIVMLMTTSQGRNFYDVERWAGRNRGPGSDNNNNVLNAPLTDLGGSTIGGPQFLESTLPYEQVITPDPQTQKLPGPTGDTPFVINQSYWVKGAPPIFSPGKFRDKPSAGDPDGFGKVKDGPKGDSLLGSGGNFLSNEIFYRTALLRQRLRPSLASGHLHVPSTDIKPQTTGPNLLTGVGQALVRFLQNSFRLQVSAITFPLTVVNTGASGTLMVTNDTTDILNVAAVDVAAPFSVQLPGPLPISVTPGSTLTVTSVFTPTAVGTFSAFLTARDVSGEVLLMAALTGQSIPSLPQITSFSPAFGRPGTLVTILGQNLDGAVDVRIGGGSVPFNVISSTQITATVTVDASTGLIEVQTPNGVATSSGTFRVIILPPPRGPIEPL